MARTKRTAPGFDPAASDQVWEAISVLRGKLPAMTKFARIVTGNDNLTVDITTGVPHTRGNKVFIRPPLGLGSKREHERSVCGSRGEGGKQRCAACQLREVIDFYLFHELAHVIGKTQQLVTKREIKKARVEALKLHPEGCEHHKQVMDRLAHIEAVGSDSMTLGNAFNPWMAMMINSLEDSRVNEMTFASRPGMRTIFNMNMQRLLTEGSEVGVDQNLAWTEAPLDSQFIVGLQIAASGYAFEGEFAPEVMQALADPKLVRLCQQAITSDTVFQIFNLCLEVHKRANELGFCKVDPCVVEPPREEEPDLGSLGNPGGDGQSEASGEDDARSDAESGGGGVDPASGEDDSPSPSSADESGNGPDAKAEDAAGDAGEDGGAWTGSDGGSSDGSGDPKPEDGGDVNDSGDGEPGSEPSEDTGSGADGDAEGSGEAGDESDEGSTEDQPGSGGVQNHLATVYRMMDQPTSPTMLVSVGRIHKREQLPQADNLIRHETHTEIRTRTHTNWKVQYVTRGPRRWCLIQRTWHTSQANDRSQARQQEMKEVDWIPVALAKQMLRSAPRGRASRTMTRIFLNTTPSV
jgi:hypothetical protein